MLLSYRLTSQKRETMSFKITIAQTANDSDRVEACGQTPSEAISRACESIGLLDSGVFSLRQNINGTLAVHSSVASLSATLSVVN